MAGLPLRLLSTIRQGTPVVSVAVPDVKDMNRGAFDGEEDAPRSASPVQQLPNFAVEGVTFRRNGMRFRK